MKIYVAVTGEPLPISLVVELGMSMIVDASEKYGGNKSQVWQGKPRTRPGEVAGGSAYDTRAYLRRMGIKASIPVNVRNRCRPRH
jgi:hypothetical protein